MNDMKITMLEKSSEMLKIYHLLTPKHRADLWNWVRLAFAAENSVRKSLGFDVLADSVSSLKAQEFPCEKLLQRREK
jgi:hypothetical protein